MIVAHHNEPEQMCHAHRFRRPHIRFNQSWLPDQRNADKRGHLAIDILAEIIFNLL